MSTHFPITVTGGVPGDGNQAAQRQSSTSPELDRLRSEVKDLRDRLDRLESAVARGPVDLMRFGGRRDILPGFPVSFSRINLASKTPAPVSHDDLLRQLQPALDPLPTISADMLPHGAAWATQAQASAGDRE